MSSSKDDKKDEVLCEFFGIEITTKNPNLAKVLKTEVSDIMNLDVTEVKGYLANSDQESIDSFAYNSADVHIDETEIEVEIEIDDVISESQDKSGSDKDEDDDVGVDKLVDDWLDKY